MLYDPKWTKADPFKLATLIAWLETQPREGTYCWNSSHNCLLCRYLTACGFADVNVFSDQVSYASDGRGWRFLPNGWADIAYTSPYTFGAALERARAAAAKTDT